MKDKEIAKIVSRDEDLWSKMVQRLKDTIKGLEDELQVNKCFLDTATKQLSLHKDK